MPLTLEEILKIIAGPETHYWLQRAAKEVEDMDPVDALHDVEMLLQLCKARLYKVQNG